MLNKCNIRWFSFDVTTRAPSLWMIFNLKIPSQENDLIPYNCSSSPILLATSVQQFGYKLPYSTYFGGVTAVSLEHFLLINGFPNRFLAWLMSFWSFGSERHRIKDFLRLAIRAECSPWGRDEKCKLQSTTALFFWLTL